MLGGCLEHSLGDKNAIPHVLSMFKNGRSRPHFMGRKTCRGEDPTSERPVGQGHPDPGQEALRLELRLQTSPALVALLCQRGHGPPGEARGAGRLTALLPLLSGQGALALLKVVSAPWLPQSRR